jgi:hypothetical protein
MTPALPLISARRKTFVMTRQEAKQCRRGSLVEYQGQRATIVSLQIQSSLQPPTFSASFTLRTEDGELYPQIDYRKLLPLA